MAVDHREVEPAIKIGIQKYAAESQPVFRSQSHSALGGYVHVISIAGRAVEADHLVVEVGDGHARPSRIVEVSHVHAHARPGLALGAESDSGLDRDILECAAAL